MPSLIYVSLHSLVICVLILVARSKRERCNWGFKKARDRYQIGILGILAVQLGGFLLWMRDGELETQTAFLMAIVQWTGIYWVALAVYRRRDLVREQKNA